MAERKRWMPFGYCIVTGDITIHEKEADTIRRIFEIYIGGQSYSAITALLNTEVIRYHSGAAWNKHMVKRILENRTYLGERGYPAIVAAAVFAAVNERKAKNPSCRPKPRKSVSNNNQFRLLSFTPSAKALRLTNEINRALERNPDVEKVHALIFACAAEKYKSLMLVPIVEVDCYE